jgi:hypothetical protein
VLVQGQGPLMAGPWSLCTVHDMHSIAHFKHPTLIRLHAYSLFPETGLMSGLKRVRLCSGSCSGSSHMVIQPYLYGLNRRNPSRSKTWGRADIQVSQGSQSSSSVIFPSTTPTLDGKGSRSRILSRLIIASHPVTRIPHTHTYPQPLLSSWLLLA